MFLSASCAPSAGNDHEHSAAGALKGAPCAAEVLFSVFCKYAFLERFHNRNWTELCISSYYIFIYVQPLKYLHENIQLIKFVFFKMKKIIMNVWSASLKQFR